MRERGVGDRALIYMASRTSAVAGESDTPSPEAFLTGANSCSRSISNAANVAGSVKGNVSKMKSSILIPLGASGVTIAWVAKSQYGIFFLAICDPSYHIISHRISQRIMAFAQLSHILYIIRDKERKEETASRRAAGAR